MVYNNTPVVKENAEDIVVESMSLLETSLYITECEHKMFESVINVDFANVLTEADDVTEQNFFQKVWGKMKELVDKLWNAIKNGFENAMNRIANLLANDKKLLEKYDKLAKEGKLHFGTELEVPDFNYSIDYSRLENIVSKFAKTFAVSKKLSTKEDIENTYNGILEELDKVLEDQANVKTGADIAGWTKKKIAMNEVKTAAEFIRQNMQNGGVLAKLKKEKDDMLKDIKAIKDSVDAEDKAFKPQKGDDVASFLAYRINMEYKAVAKMSKAATKQASYAINTYFKMIKNARAIVKAACAENDEQASEEAKNESAIKEFLMLEASDLYCDAVFCY